MVSFLNLLAFESDNIQHIEPLKKLGIEISSYAKLITHTLDAEKPILLKSQGIKLGN